MGLFSIIKHREQRFHSRIDLAELLILYFIAVTDFGIRFYCRCHTDQFLSGFLDGSKFFRDIYLPKGSWTDIYTGKVYEGGQTVTAFAPLEIIPVFVRDKKELRIY